MLHCSLPYAILIYVCFLRKNVWEDAPAVPATQFTIVFMTPVPHNLCREIYVRRKNKSMKQKTLASDAVLLEYWSREKEIRSDVIRKDAVFAVV